jgi:hypothetical protein
MRFHATVPVRTVRYLGEFLLKSAVTLRMQKKKMFSPYFFLITYLQEPTVLKILFCAKFVLKSYTASIISEKGRIRIRTPD